MKFFMIRRTVYFPKQKNDYKRASRQLRKSVFKDFVIGKSKDRRKLYLEFETQDVHDVMIGVLQRTLEKMEYEYEILQED